MLSSTAPSFLLALCPDRKNRQWGMAFLDISTGEFFIVPADYDPEGEFQILKAMKKLPCF